MLNIHTCSFLSPLKRPLTSVQEHAFGWQTHTDHPHTHARSPALYSALPEPSLLTTRLHVCFRWRISTCMCVKKKKERKCVSQCVGETTKETEWVTVCVCVCMNHMDIMCYMHHWTHRLWFSHAAIRQLCCDSCLIWRQSRSDSCKKHACVCVCVCVCAETYCSPQCSQARVLAWFFAVCFCPQQGSYLSVWLHVGGWALHFFWCCYPKLSSMRIGMWVAAASF